MIIKSISCSCGKDTGVYMSPRVATFTLQGAIFMICLENTFIILDFFSSSPCQSVFMLENIQQSVSIWIEYTGRTIFIKIIFHFFPSVIVMSRLQKLSLITVELRYFNSISFVI